MWGTIVSRDGKMRLLIVGSGGVGGYLGARLLQAGADVHFLARGEHAEAMRRRGLEIVEEGSSRLYPVTVTEDASGLGLFDLLIISVKSVDLQSALDAISENVGEKSLILPVMNGVEQLQKIQERYAQARVLPACIYIVSNILRAGVIEKRGKVFKLCWGDAERESSEYADISRLFDRAGFRHEYSRDIARAQWRKYIFISSMATLTSFYGETMREIYDRHGEELEAAMREVASVASAKGIEIGEEEIEKSMKQASQVSEGAKTSMQLDIERGKKPELESLTGYVCTEASRLGLETPVLSSLYQGLLERLS